MTLVTLDELSERASVRACVQFAKITLPAAREHVPEYMQQCAVLMLELTEWCVARTKETAPTG
jgi:hypothetical protein